MATNDDDKREIEVETTAWVIVHTPKGQGGLHTTEEAEGAHAFGPFFSRDEVDLWSNSPDECDQFVMEIVAVRPMLVAGPMYVPPGIAQMAEAALAQHEQRRKDARNEQRRKDARN